jgi:hypothetical protein
MSTLRGFTGRPSTAPLSSGPFSSAFACGNPVVEHVEHAMHIQAEDARFGGARGCSGIRNRHGT